MNSSRGDVEIKHLEFVQGTIARQANNSFVVKGWTFPIVLALLGFSVERNSWNLAVLALVPITGFWYLDAYYLRQERLFRCLYNELIEAPASVKAFSMTTRRFQDQPECRWPVVLRQPPLSPFYIGFIAIVMIVSITVIAS
jgi:hypothetical protein